MVNEFVEGAHFMKHDTKSERYYEYLRNKHQSKAFQFGIFAGSTMVFVFIRKNKNFSKYAKMIYSVNLFLASFVFTYELWTKMFTDKNKVHILDEILLS
jgi:hypothetical protein